MPGNYTLLIDYAHNAVSMENILTTCGKYRTVWYACLALEEIGRNPRWYEMGEVRRLADLTVITEIIPV